MNIVIKAYYPRTKLNEYSWFFPFSYYYKMKSYMFLFLSLTMVHVKFTCLLSSYLWFRFLSETCFSQIIFTYVYMCQKKKNIRSTFVLFYTLFHMHILILVCFIIQSSQMQTDTKGLLKHACRVFKINKASGLMASQEQRPN